MPDFYSPPGGRYPQELPDRWKFADGTVRTDLQSLSGSELAALDWVGPITMPAESSYFTQDHVWNSSTRTFDVSSISDDEKESRVDYRRFWRDLSAGSLYQKIKAEAKTSLPANVVATELISLLTDARQDDPNSTMIQSSLNELLTTITFTTDELAELQTIFVSSGMNAIYTLPE